MAGEEGDAPAAESCERFEGLALGCVVQRAGRSSSIVSSAGRRNARASAIFCHWPMLGSMPSCSQRPSRVSSPCGQLLISGPSPASHAARSTSGDVSGVSGWPMRMLSRKVS